MKLLQGTILSIECDQCKSRMTIAGGYIGIALNDEWRAKADVIIEQNGWSTGADAPDLCPACLVSFLASENNSK